MHAGTEFAFQDSLTALATEDNVEEHEAKRLRHGDVTGLQPSSYLFTRFPQAFSLGWYVTRRWRLRKQVLWP